MSPEKNKKLKKLRLDLDKIDDKLIKIIKKDLKLLNQFFYSKQKRRKLSIKNELKSF